MRKLMIYAVAGGSTKLISSRMAFLSLPMISKPARSSTSACLAQLNTLFFTHASERDTELQIFWPTSFDRSQGSDVPSNFNKELGITKFRTYLKVA